tara:strand:+ start:1294 stop:1566 length:273 start_codon:yes stop_codon:yes gene_type:complete
MALIIHYIPGNEFSTDMWHGIREDFENGSYLYLSGKKLVLREIGEKIGHVLNGPRPYPSGVCGSEHMVLGDFLHFRSFKDLGFYEGMLYE